MNSSTTSGIILRFEMYRRLPSFNNKTSSIIKIEEKKKKMFCLEDLPNELFLIIFCYLKKFELIESFFQLNKRLNNLLLKYISYINLSTIYQRNKIKYFLTINRFILSLTIDNYQIGNDFINQIQLKNLSRIKFIDNGIDLQEKFCEKFQPNILNLVITSLNSNDKQYKFISKSLKRLDIEFYIGEYAKNYLLNQFHFYSTSILVHIRIIFSKLSEYFQLFNCDFPIHIEKFSISIFSIDKTDFSHSIISLPYLKDFQLEICQIPFYLIQYLLPSNTNNNSLQRFAFIGQTTTINAKSWKLLLNKYQSIQRFDLHLSNVKDFQLSDIEEWKKEFPSYLIDYNSLNNIFRIHSSKFDNLERILLNESIENFNHIEYSNKISHLIIRSQYWCSYINISLNIQHDLLTRFKYIKRLSTNSRQLEYFLQTKFLNQIEQLDLEFSEKYCYLDNHIVEQFHQLKSIYFYSMYDGIYDIKLHSIIKDILLKKFTKIFFLYIDAIRIIDDEDVENSISQWYLLELNQPKINYIQGKFLSIWF